MVISHAINMSRATSHRTILNRIAAPAPITDEDITWVVDTGKPNTAVP